ncbi:unnamed protein product [Chrysodeixis includens]|uniref:Single domain major allergen protein n=1 Tax=Chrysodeixis includens TaxID=689277 RepID=A0A9P0FWQ8_CHRIL|nr:unnamed protein product [Chrysodeixis includens]
MEKTSQNAGDPRKNSSLKLNSEILMRYICVEHFRVTAPVRWYSGNGTTMMKAILVLALVATAFSAPQPRKDFHEHVEEFLDIIMEDAGHELQHLLEHYEEYEEFWAAVNYMRTNNFKDIVYEMESLPEFVAVIDFLENDNIDVHYFLDLLNELIESSKKSKQARHTTSGRDLTAFIKDSINEFPKDKLSALFDQKMNEDAEFRVAIENLQSEEWDQIFGALWDSPVFQAEVKTLSENGIEISVLLDELKAIFGQ